MSFSKIFQILFIVGSTFLIFIPEYLNNSWWCFSSSFSTFEDRRRISPKSWSVLLKIHSSSLCHPLIIVFDCENSILTHPEHFRVVFISWSSKGHHFRRFLRSKFSASFSKYSKLMSLRSSQNLTGASFKYSLFSSSSIRSLVSKSPQVSSFVFQFFPVNCAFATFISNSYGGSFKSSLPSLSYRFIRSFQSYRWFVEDLPKFVPYLS